MNLKCCVEYDKLKKKCDGEHNCVTEMRGFHLNCLETEVLDAVYHHFQTSLYNHSSVANRMR